MTDPNQPIEPEVTADAAHPEAEEQVVEAEVVDEAAVDAAPESATPAGGATAPGEGKAVGDAEVHPDTTRADKLQDDYLRLQAEYVNYKRRVDRDREQLRNNALAGFVESLLPVLDEIHLARQHGDLAEGTPFAKIAEKLDGILGKYGLSSFGEAGDAFDPMHHEALMHVEAEVPEGSEGTTVVQVMQPGYKVGERVVRPARVAVADPQ